MNLLDLIRKTNGKFFTVTFRKRGDGSLRHMICRTGVHKHLRGGGLSFDPKEHGLQIVFDIEKKAYRSFAPDSVTFFKCGSRSWRKA